ncbi:MAG: hypothetical protein JWN29_2868 [Acidimicrobiales bacterium]|nr:hypothetical protein [Acidimicrobiales bacterium]
MLLPWLLRLAWLSLPLTAGSVLADALHERSTSVQLVVAVVAWAVWAMVVLALLVPRPMGLTALRVVAPAALAAAVWASTETGDGAVLVALAAVPLILSFLPEVGEWMVNGGAYGYERRYLLRAPGALLLGPIAVAEVALVAGALTGPLLLAAHRWLAGAVALVAGGAVVVVCARALHQLSLRWAVLVPAGLVVKDHVTLLDPILFKRTLVEVLQPAPADTDALDLTARAPGVPLELRLKESEPVMLITPGKRANQPGHTAKLMFTPTRPGALLADAGTRRIPTQPASPPPATSSPT